MPSHAPARPGSLPGLYDPKFDVQYAAQLGAAFAPLNAELAATGKATGRPAVAPTPAPPDGPGPRRAAIHTQRDDQEARADARREAALGSNVKTDAPPGSTSETPTTLSPWASSLGRRYSLQVAAKHLLPSEKGLQGCHAWLARNDRGGVGIIAYPSLDKARFDNLQTCASVWSCPLCAAKICERRRELEVAPALVAAKLQGLAVLMVTFTVKHYRNDKLQALIDGLRVARRSSRTGKRYARIAKRYGIVGSIRSFEITYGANGWHPHLHDLLFLAPGYDRAALIADLRVQWSNGVALARLRGVNSHGVQVSDAHAKIEEYITKMGRDPAWGLAEEITKQPVKAGRMNPETGEKGRSAFQLLSDYNFEGDIQAGALYVEYAQVMKGQRQLYWSPGLKKRFGVDDLSDEQIEKMETNEKLAVRMGELTPSEYSLIRQDGMREYCLDVARAADPAALAAFLQPYRVECVTSVTTTHLAGLAVWSDDDRYTVLPEADPYQMDPLVRELAVKAPTLSPAERAAMASRLYARQASGESMIGTYVADQRRAEVKAWVLNGPQAPARTPGAAPAAPKAPHAGLWD